MDVSKIKISDELLDIKDAKSREDITMTMGLLDGFESKTSPKSNDLSLEQVLLITKNHPNKTGVMEYHQPQGLCYSPQGCLVSFIPTLTYAYGVRTCKIDEYNLITGNLLRSFTVEGMHASTLSYNNGYVYVPQGVYYDNSGNYIYQNKVMVYRYSDFVLVAELTFPELIYVTKFAINHENGHLFAGYGYTVKEYSISSDFSTKTLIKTVTLSPPENIGDVTQGFCFWNGYIAHTSSSPNNVVFYNIEKAVNNDTVYHTMIYNIPYATKNGVFTGELEGISAGNDGDFIISTFSHDNDKSYTSTIPIIRFNVLKNVGSNNDIITSNTATTSRVLYVNKTTATNKQDGTIAHPFSDIQRAVNSVIFTTKADGLKFQINIMDANTYDFVLVTKCEKALYIYNASGGTVNIKGMRCTDATNLYVSGITFLPFSSSERDVLTLYRSNVNLENVVINGQSTAQYGVYISDGSNIRIIAGCTVSGVTSGGTYISNSSQFGEFGGMTSLPRALIGAKGQLYPNTNSEGNTWNYGNNDGTHGVAIPSKKFVVDVNSFITTKLEAIELSLYNFICVEYEYSDHTYCRMFPTTSNNSLTCEINEFNIVNSSPTTGTTFFLAEILFTIAETGVTISRNLKTSSIVTGDVTWTQLSLEGNGDNTFIKLRRIYGLNL